MNTLFLNKVVNEDRKNITYQQIFLLHLAIFVSIISYITNIV